MLPASRQLVTIVAAATSLVLACALPAGADGPAPSARAGDKNAVLSLDESFRTPQNAAQRDWLTKQNTLAAKVGCEVGRQTADRRSSCFVEFIPFRVVQLPSGKEIGRGVIGSGNTTQLDYKSSTYVQDVNLGLVQASGVATLLSRAKVAVDCKASSGGGCTVTGGGGEQWLRYPAQNQHFTFKVTSPGKNISYHQPPVKVTVSNLAAPNKLTRKLGDTAQVRCDSEPVGSGTGRGCVNWTYEPTYTLDTHDPRITQVAWHVYWAQNNLRFKWGLQGKGRPLHHLSDVDLQRYNRQVACPRGKYPGKSCDEYPFAATYEGAGLNSDYSTHAVPLNQNTTEGGSEYRGKFLRENRILDHDAYWVHVKR
ncbi:hypothetical protein [Streptomyces sp. NPDC049585]|uniref:NucA/NucB deoxyribonuclease domain-containing protein n=1 Tax=Streptomyces sp. NPDC049585 TaxID=3155154 RepID=UPI0034411C61